VCGIYSFKIGAARRRWIYLTLVWCDFVTE